MKIEFITEMVNTDKFRDLFKRQQYEQYVLAILNNSKNLFEDNHFTKSLSEANGECDFIDKNGIKYDVKLLINSSQGEKIGQRKNDLNRWIEEMIDESCEFSECVNKKDLSLITNTKLYGIMESQMEKFAEDENAILFCPFPIVMDSRDSIFLQFATDILQAVYDELKIKKNSKGTKNRKTFFIYPSVDKNYFVLRDAESGIREFIENTELEDYISFQTYAYDK